MDSAAWSSSPIQPCSSTIHWSESVLGRHDSEGVAVHPRAQVLTNESQSH